MDRYLRIYHVSKEQLGNCSVRIIKRQCNSILAYANCPWENVISGIKTQFFEIRMGFFSPLQARPRSEQI